VKEDEEGTILCYNNTKDKKFPLILVIGREANTTKKIVPGTGSYDFKDAPKCGVWNTAFKIMAESKGEGLDVKQLKKKFENKSSPICFADCLPQGILNNVKNKNKIRQKLIENEEIIKQHIEEIFSNETIINRVKLIFLHGIDIEIFKNSVEQIRDLAEKNKIDKENIVFFSFFILSNWKKINGKYPEEKVKRIYCAWEEEPT
jgi:uncharacterized protein YhhL (DUF1145 family)